MTVGLFCRVARRVTTYSPPVRTRILLSLTIVAGACGPSGSNPYPPEYPDDPQPPDAGVAAKPKPVEVSLADVGLSAEDMNPRADPCTDFYEYACGGWLARTEIPADQSDYNRFREITDRNLDVLREILESSASTKTGSFYAACMNEEANEKDGLAGVQPLLSKIAGLDNRQQLPEVLAAIHRHAIWPAFRLDRVPDFKDSTRNISFLSQGGLGLPDREYYVSEDKSRTDVLAAYRLHVARMFELVGDSKAAAKKAAGDVLRIETALAKASKTRVERRDPAGIYNKVDRKGLAKLAPEIEWDAYFSALGHEGIVDISVEAPKALTAVGAAAKSEPIRAWKSYLRWHVLAAVAPTLPKKLADHAFELEKLLSGTESQKPRWKRCVSATDDALRDLLAKQFVDKQFSPEAKQAAIDMVVQIRTAFGKRLDRLDWMSAETKARARQKLEAMELLVGYPDKFDTYDFEVGATTYTANVLRASAYELSRELNKVGKPYDRTEWPISAAIVNAGYNPLANHMVFPAGILQPRFFDANAHYAVNLGGLGLVVGHELTHGFDDQGRKFDAKGNLSEWWTQQDAKQFESRAQCVVDHYGAYEPIKGEHINGTLTLGENIADIGGALLGWDAYKAIQAKTEQRVVADGLNEDQLFFVAIGQAWCDEKRGPELRRRLITDPHSPPRYRIQGVIANHPEFARAFSCEKPEAICSVW